MVVTLMDTFVAGPRAGLRPDTPFPAQCQGLHMGPLRFATDAPWAELAPTVEARPELLPLTAAAVGKC
jgi:hypothetical protein